MSRVIVLGAAGRTGQLIVEEVARAGHHVTAAARRAEGMVHADVRDEASLRSAIAGHDVVVSAIGPPGRRSGNLYSDGARATVAAMRATGVRRYLALSSVGVRPDDPHAAWWYRYLLRPIAADLYADMHRMEEIVRATELDWTFVRPSHLRDHPPTGTYRVTDNATPPGGRRITRTDLARFIAAELTEHRWSRRAPSLAE
ncbi:NAD(P)-dependent oxidoreductase [Actinoplanes sp. NPDC049265]|uniref:NAD(P)-dependent oxidoreductase n=1 Tax=Actinoplanes sp. NPDC049265 TaxID=3363902 RepID=UPI003721971F